MRTPGSLALPVVAALIAYGAIWTSSPAGAASKPKPAPIAHLLTVGTNGKLIPVRPGMKIGNLTVPDTDLTTEMSNTFGPEGCVAINTDNVLDLIYGGIESAAAVFGVIWLILTRKSSEPNDDEAQDQEEEGGSTIDQGLCLTQAGGVPVMGSCGTSGAALSSATWILGTLQGEFSLRNLYYYNKGENEYLRTTGYTTGDAIQLHLLFPGTGGQEEEAWTLSPR